MLIQTRELGSSEHNVVRVRGFTQTCEILNPKP